MEDLSRKPLLEITLVRGPDRRYKAYCAMRSHDGFVVGRDMLRGKGLRDAFASWQRWLVHNQDVLIYFNVRPVLRPQLDRIDGEARELWVKRLQKESKDEVAKTELVAPWEVTQKGEQI